MAVEIAIQRELAHRMKVTAPHLRPSNSNSTKEVFPSQFTSPSQASKSIALPGSTPRLSLSPNLSGTKRKETLPVSTASNPPQQNRQPFHRDISHKAEADDNVYCKICNLSCSSPFNLKQHLMGYKHREKLLELESGKKSGTSENSRSYERHWCDMCKISCMNEELLKLPFKVKSTRLN
ncbi:hypothetical protein PIB30_027744 [Stylosanthes scabra]|nr:hypothetical protein [Stylosanthes scabra]